MNLNQVLNIVDRGTAWRWIVGQYLSAGPACPGCGKIINGTRALAAFDRIDRTYCRFCESNSPARAFVPVLRGTEWQPEEYVKFLLLHLVGQTPVEIGLLLGKSASCVRDMVLRAEILTGMNTTGDRLLVDRDKKGAPRGGGAGNGTQTMEVER